MGSAHGSRRPSRSRYAVTDDSRHHAAPDGALPGREAGERPRVKPWGGRFTGEQAPLFERINASLPFDYVLAPYDIAGS